MALSVPIPKHLDTIVPISASSKPDSVADTLGTEEASAAILSGELTAKSLHDVQGQPWNTTAVSEEYAEAARKQLETDIDAVLERLIMYGQEPTSEVPSYIVWDPIRQLYMGRLQNGQIVVKGYEPEWKLLDIGTTPNGHRNSDQRSGTSALGSGERKNISADSVFKA